MQTLDHAPPLGAEEAPPGAAAGTTVTPASPPAPRAPYSPDILLIDANSLGYASMYSAVGKLSHNDIPTGGIHGVLNSIFGRMARHPGAVPVALFDRRATWRHELFPDYKSNRGNTPEKIAIREAYAKQVPVVQMLMGALGMPQISCGEAEADDLGGVICREINGGASHASAEADGDLQPVHGEPWKIELTTRDTDWYQSLCDYVTWFSPLTQTLVTLDVLTDPQNTLSDGYFLSTREYLQAKALAGDTSDTIPGIEKVGQKTACKFMREHGGSIESFWARVDNGSVTPKGVIMERLANAESRAIYERNIVLMDWSRAPPLRTDLLAFSQGAPDWKEVRAISDEFGLKKILTRAQEILKRWDGGWGPAIDAIDAALHSQRLQPKRRMAP